VFGRTREVSIDPLTEEVNPARVRAVGDNITSSSPSAASMLRRFSSRLGSGSGMIVPGLELDLMVKDGELTGGCIEGMMM